MEINTEQRNCSNRIYNLKACEILMETDACNFETQCCEDGGEYNDVVHDAYGYICDASSEFTKENLEKE